MVCRPIFYDTETTGLKPETDRIIEIAAYDPEKNRTFSELINPEIPIPPESIAIHNITNEMISQAPTFSVIGQRFIDFCVGDVILIAHNNDNFDLPFLQSAFSRHLLSFPSTWSFLDSLKWARKYRYDLPRHSLQYLREVYNIPANQAHRALNDVMILKEVFKMMTGDLPIDMVSFLLKKDENEENAPPQHMTFGKYSGTPLDQVPQHYINWLHKEGVFEKKEHQKLKEALIKLNRIKT